jgi:hypothetical protein
MKSMIEETPDLGGKQMNKTQAGALAGTVATAPMTAVMMALHQQLPWHERHPLPPEDITGELARRAGVERRLNKAEHLTATGIGHFGFGAGAGVIYGSLGETVNAPPVLKGVIFGLLVWFVSYLGWLPAADILHQTKEQPPRPNAMMIIAHIVWGACLGILTEHWARGESSE